MSHSFLIEIYAVYGAISLTLTIWLARVLFRNGAVFLEDVFADNPRMAEAVNRLLVVGFYLLNLGYACVIMRANVWPWTTSDTSTAVGCVEVLALKLGMLLLSLCGIHFCNLYLFHRIRQRSRLATLPPPVAPQMKVAPCA